MFRTGSSPQERLSELLSRLSPITKTIPGRMRVGARSSCQARRRYGSFRRRPLMYTWLFLISSMSPGRPITRFTKGVIGLPGDMLEIRNNHVYINGRRLKEPYLRRAWHDDRAPTRILPGMVFVMGDNRDNSSDSRSWGELPVRNIQAKAWLRYWPPSRIEILH